MVDGYASHPVFKIGELARLIASHVLPSRKSAVNFSCASVSRKTRPHHVMGDTTVVGDPYEGVAWRNLGL